jgi:hypothetical protein
MNPIAFALVRARLDKMFSSSPALAGFWLLLILQLSYLVHAAMSEWTIGATILAVLTVFQAHDVVRLQLMRSRRRDQAGE